MIAKAAARRAVFHLVYHWPSRCWALKYKRRIVQVFRYAKALAIKDAAAIVRDNYSRSQLVIHNLDGTIQSERTYGADPVRHKG